MKTIAITCSVTADYCLHPRYARYIEKAAEEAGVKILPVILPTTRNTDLIRGYAEEFDGFLASGGGDVEPSYYGEERIPECGGANDDRDFFELELLKNIIRLDKPAFGICRGIQTMNVAAGGTLWQDFPSQVLGNENHRTVVDDSPVHVVHPQGELAVLLGDTIKTNSYHHQAIKKPGDSIIITAVSHDGINEAMRKTDMRFYAGYQWHPEISLDEISMKIIAPFIEAVAGG